MMTWRRTDLAAAHLKFCLPMMRMKVERNDREKTHGERREPEITTERAKIIQRMALFKSTNRQQKRPVPQSKNCGCNHFNYVLCSPLLAVC